MSGKTGIQWTASDDGTPGYAWNPVVGCTRVSAGCDHCYAFQLHDQRHIAWKRGRWPSAPAQYHQPFSRVQVLPERLMDPYHWRKPRRVFVNSMSDLFHPDVPLGYVLDVWETMRANPQHTFQILTKRPKLMRDWCREVFASAPGYANLPNVWLGVSVEDQHAADERIPLLLETPAALRFLSCEPLLGPIALNARNERAPFDMMDGTIDWVIIGGESGQHARMMNPNWAWSLVIQCDEAGVPVFVKQLGSELAFYYSLKDRHGGDMSEWPPDLYPIRLREFPLAMEQSDVAVTR